MPRSFALQLSIFFVKTLASFFLFFLLNLIRSSGSCVMRVVWRLWAVFTYFCCIYSIIVSIRAPFFVVNDCRKNGTSKWLARRCRETATDDVSSARDFGSSPRTNKRDFLLHLRVSRDNQKCE